MAAAIHRIADARGVRILQAMRPGCTRAEAARAFATLRTLSDNGTRHAWLVRNGYTGEGTRKALESAGHLEPPMERCARRLCSKGVSSKTFIARVHGRIYCSAACAQRDSDERRVTGNG